MSIYHWEHELPQKVLAGVLEALEVDTTHFLMNLEKDQPKEVMMFIWIWSRYREHRHPKAATPSDTV